MSYDTVALVAREPGLERVIRVLEQTASDLWVSPHPDTAMLELRDGDGALLATVEPGLAMASRQEIGRLLGQDTQDTAPDPCWWVETRARPDEAGRRVADGFAQTLAARLGGTVWTSGPADTAFWTETAHPAIDRVTDRAVLVSQDRPVVPWSSWLADAAVRGGGERGLQLRTPASSRLTLSAWTAVTASRGLWVVQDGDGGHFDGTSGLALSWDEQQGFVPHVPDPPGKRRRKPVGQVPEGPVPAFLDEPPTGTHLEVRLSIVHPEGEEPRIGRGAEVLAECLSGPPPAAWDLHEPLTRPWDPARMLDSARHRAPERLLLHFAGPWEQGHPYVGRIGLTWSGDVLSEEVTMLVGLEQGAEGQSLSRLAETVEALGERDLLDTLWARRFVGRPDTTHVPVWRGLGSPLGIAVGPRRAEKVGLTATENGPIPGTPFGPPEHRSVWYPALGDVDDPRRALKVLRAQWQHLTEHAQQ
ncbi:DUF6177 family protein [Nocardiopsis xinjiangensis]|uniref:DUF6177 family protein n=1 Tax=Nocardiopsis xinjiangensis TaxID=124285 RepID=UPI000348E5AA|nr:DUF6177 family protein [Nocardiopsis xinjiangensis]